MKPLQRRLGRTAIAVPALLLLPVAFPQGTGQDEPTFDPAADAKAAVKRATEVAAKKNKRVLVVWGHDASEGHVDLHTALRRGKTEAWPFYYEYQLVPVDTGADGRRNAELARALGATPAAGAAMLTVLDAAGEPLANQAAARFLGDDGWSQAELGRFLAEHVVEPLDAEEVMKKALTRAKAKNKRLFVHLGAPW